MSQTYKASLESSFTQQDKEPTAENLQLLHKIVSGGLLD